MGPAELVGGTGTREDSRGVLTGFDSLMGGGAATKPATPSKRKKKAAAIPAKKKSSEEISNQLQLDRCLSPIKVCLNISELNLNLLHMVERALGALSGFQGNIMVVPRSQQSDSLIELREAEVGPDEITSRRTIVIGKRGGRDIHTAVKLRAWGYLEYSPDADTLDEGALRSIVHKVSASKYAVFSEITDPQEGARAFGYSEQRDCPLSLEEREILKLASEGFSNERIREEKNMATSTVKNKFSRIYDKLDANSRAHAIAICYRKGWIV